MVTPYLFGFTAPNIPNKMTRSDVYWIKSIFIPYSIFTTLSYYYLLLLLLYITLL